MTPQIMKQAVLKKPGLADKQLHLVRLEKGCYRWIEVLGEKPFGPDWLSEHDAIKGIRVEIETNPEFVGVDLTVTTAQPSAEMRAAESVVEYYETIFATVADINARNPESRSEQVQSVMDCVTYETNLADLLEHFQVMLAYNFRNRRVYARALFPVRDGKEPRDLVGDGLLLNCIQAIEKSTGQKLDNLKAVLLEPVSNITVVGGSALPKRGIQ